MKDVRLLLAVLGLLVLVHIVNYLLHYQLNQFGIAPRVLERLPYIFSAPFLHGSLSHLLNNLVGMATFGTICLLNGRRFFLWNSFFIITVGGLLVWACARPSLHIGASGWIFGLWSLSIALAWFRRSLLNFVVAVVVIFFYGGMIYGVLPRDVHVSFESHLFGALAGVLAAANYSRRR